MMGGPMIDPIGALGAAFGRSVEIAGALVR